MFNVFKDGGGGGRVCPLALPSTSTPGRFVPADQTRLSDPEQAELLVN